MASEVRDNYIRALYDVSKADPHKWATFLEAFSAMVNDEYEKSLSAPANDALISVGNNRRLRDLRQDFIHIETIMAKYKK
jgi:hypothetical protein